MEDQIIHIKKGRLNGLGFEPAFNAYFDFYLDRKYFGVALLDLQDLAFHLYLRKNLNDANPNWKMPTVRQLKKKFGISCDRIYAILARLERARLLIKQSGVRQGSANVRNTYVLSDPIATFSEFLEVARQGFFTLPLLPEYQILPVEASQADEVEASQVAEVEANQVAKIEANQVAEVEAGQIAKIEANQVAKPVQMVFRKSVRMG